MALQIIKMNGDTQPLGKKWLQGFIHCNPQIASVIGWRIEPAQLHETQPEQLQAFFDTFDGVRT